MDPLKNQLIPKQNDGKYSLKFSENIDYIKNLLLQRQKDIKLMNNHLSEYTNLTSNQTFLNNKIKY